MSPHVEAPAPTKVPILGKETIIIENGLWLDFVADDLIQHVKADPTAKIKFALVTDTNLAQRYVPDFKKSFEVAREKAGSSDELVVFEIPPGEGAKTRDTVGAIHDWLADNKCTRDAVMIALGGGVVGDMVGYAAATWMRGVSVVQVPTTLLAMVDSSIGGKTAIDTPYGKNLVGAFHQPKRIYIDTKFIQSLPKREVINGMAEVIKTAAIWDEEEFVNLENDADDVLNYLEGERVDLDNDPKMAKIFKRLIYGSASVKAHVVSVDEKEGGLRNLLNFGHSIGHAMEAILAPQILHGECVSIGMVKEAELSRFLGHLHPGAVARLTKVLSSYGLPVSLGDKTVQKRSAGRPVPTEDVLRIMAVDKKNAGGKKKIVLLSAIGKTYEPKATVVEDEIIRVILNQAVRVSAGPNQPKEVTCVPPGSKSISNRALVLAALGSGTCRVTNLLHSDDTQVMLNALAKMQCATFSWEDSGNVLVVNGTGGNIKPYKDELYLGNAGTASRFLTTVATLAQPTEIKHSVLTGNARMKERPIGPLVDSLKNAGVDISYLENEGSLPLNVQAAGGLEGGDLNLAATISSQYVSSLLMCAPYAKKPVTLRLVGGKPISQLYIDMTIAMMAQFGVHVEKSKKEDHTYYIPCQSYKNPATYEIESDASSATYPLAVAAITNTTCTIPNIGSKSLQGDARFAVDVLKPMGCKVEQSDFSTTVTGPPRGELKPIPTVDMEPMTDAFLTAAVLAAAAKPNESGATTNITGIANQRVKECNRIEAMRLQLAKFGVECTEHDDGIIVTGKGLSFYPTKEEIHCYDDHRVAMSFSVLGMAGVGPVLLEDKNCSAKTWPGWWDELYQTFKANLEGEEPVANQVTETKKPKTYEKSMFLIGMRGAGKTTAGRWANQSLGWNFIDLDEELERQLQTTIPEIIKEKGWEGFRKEENNMLQKMMKEKSTGYIFATGGGIVEDPTNRKAFLEYQKSGGIVLLVSRSISNIMSYLRQDKSRPAYVEDMEGVWERRKPWYYECSNFHYYSANAEVLGNTGSIEAAQREKFSDFLLYVTGRSNKVEKVMEKKRSFFVSLTTPRINADAIQSIRKATVGSEAVELRVDLLEDPNAGADGVPTVEFVVQEAAFLRSAIDIPIIFTIRTKSQGGRFPDDAHKQALELYNAALRLGFEFIDLEITWPDSLLDDIVARKGYSKIIASHHAIHGLSWKDASWVPHYNRALQYGDVIKLVGFAHSKQDNEELEGFRRWASINKTPLIAINMGQIGQLSRIQNEILTPVCHPALPFKAAKGQVSAREIRQAMTLHGEVEAKQFYVFGKPISHSRSPPLHNTLFNEIGLPHDYSRRETDQAGELKEVIQAPDFGGASVTIPLKLTIMEYLDTIAPSAKTIGAINTIVSTTNEDGKTQLIGHNTDWQGMVMALTGGGATPTINSATHKPTPGSSADSSKPTAAGLVIGGGGTARAAIYALHDMGYSPVYIVARNPQKVATMVQDFATTGEFNVQVVADVNEAKTLKGSIVAAVGTVPADKPIDPGMAEVLKVLFAQKIDDGEGTQNKVLLEMAYKPRVTELMELAKKDGWVTVPGLEALTAQGVKQFELWTGVRPDYEIARDAVLGDDK